MKTKGKRVEKYELGDKVYDEVVGLTGTITSRTEMLSGCTRYTLIPLKKDSTGSYWVEPITSVLVEKTKIKDITKPCKYELGDSVKDIITGTELVVVHREQNIAGFNRYTCRKVKIKTDDQLKDSFYFEENEIELLKKDSMKLKTNKMKEQVETGEIVRSPSPMDRTAKRW
jgi:hypothetical protein